MVDATGVGGLRDAMLIGGLVVEFIGILGC